MTVPEVISVCLYSSETDSAESVKLEDEFPALGTCDDVNVTLLADTDLITEREEGTGFAMSV